MGFQDIKPIHEYKFYCDLALRRANEAAERQRKVLRGDKRDVSRQIELNKIGVIRNVLHDALTSIMRSFPSFNDMTEFYNELIKITLDYPSLIKSLGALNNGRSKIVDLYLFYSTKMKKSNDFAQMNVYRREFAGRAFSVVKNVRKEFAFLEESRKIIAEFPSIKLDLKKVAIAGFPNVGKSTLLAQLSTSKPEIAPYAFTTKRLNLGYFIEGDNKIQLIDTPGTLNRPEKMNLIEKMAYIAMQHAADVIVYVFDLTEEYPLKEQVKLHEIVKELKKPMIIYLSKTDIIKKEVIEEFKKKFKTALTSVDELKKELEKYVISE